MIYLDNAATSFPKPQKVLEAVDYAQRNYAVNVGRGSYPLANYAASVVEETKALLARMVNAKDTSKVIFTPSATIAANEIILGLPWDKYKTIYLSPFEHNAVARPLNRQCELFGLQMNVLPFSSDTQEWDREATKLLFEQNPPDYVFISQVSNVTGLVLPVIEIAQLAKEYNAVVIVDASQSLGLLALDVQRDLIDYLIFAGHKSLYSSWGIGGFVANNNLLTPVICGGTGSDSLNLSMGDHLSGSFEAGSPNTIAIASLNASLKWINEVKPEAINKKKNQLMTLLLSLLRKDSVKLYLPSSLSNHTSILSLNVADYEPSEVGVILANDFNIAVRTGYHCAPFVHDLIGTRDRLGTVRISLGFFNTEDDIISVANALNDL